MLAVPQTDLEAMRQESAALERSLMEEQERQRTQEFFTQRERVLSVAAQVKMELLAFTPPRRAIQDATLHHESQ